MSILDKVSEGFKGIEGGLFSTVTKADVGEGFASMQGETITLLGWADPFYPDPSIPEHIKEKMIEEINKGFSSHYTMPIGSLELRTAVSKKLMECNGLDADPKRNIMITPGSDSGLFYAMSVLLNKGDEVLVPDPSYPNNFLNPKLLGAVTVPVALNKHDDYKLDIGEFEKALTDKTKMVVLTHPNNPTTTVFSRQELEQLCNFIVENDLVLVCDMAFEDMIYDDKELITPAAFEGMWERTVTVFSISKGMGLSGFRVGYIVACDRLMDIYYGAAVSVVGATNTLSQLATIEAFKDLKFMHEYKSIFEKRRKMVYKILSEVDGVKMTMPQSGFFSWIDVSDIGPSDKIVEHLIKDARVAVNDGITYGEQGKGCIRIIHGCLADEESIESVMNRIAKSLSTFK